ncbi:cation diffusion facilitator family transporter [Clostridium swellfunianum]|uniref:cation diffusion facilitator family transporter n=1 Tax=Clostridium swellfunianum TaxID=1367462 RepID=UPI00202F34E4|nr:cation diffusion facilitator family transporter [Clostridium swellfunianum]MCM0649296.1 cation diffusion facilitator family transporter [Clostridium swellfunianum]
MNSTNYKKIKQVLWVIMFANFAVALLKIIIGSAVKSASITADGFHSLTDGSSNIVGLIGISLAAKPVDREHPYGHRKFETLAGLFIAGMLLFIGGKIIVEAVNRFLNPVSLNIALENLRALIVTLAINIFVCTYEYSQGKKLNSFILLSDSLHTRSDIYVSIGVLITLVCIKLGLPSIIDPIASLIVSLFILHASYEIFKSAGSILVDKAVIDTEKIKNLALEFDQVKGVHNIRSRGSEDDVYIDMHILTEPNMSVEKSHDLIHQIEKKMRKEINNNLQVFVHLEPFYDLIRNAK